jgi:hypothetical protein
MLGLRALRNTVDVTDGIDFAQRSRKANFEPRSWTGDYVAELSADRASDFHGGNSGKGDVCRRGTVCRAGGRVPNQSDWGIASGLCDDLGLPILEYK